MKCLHCDEPPSPDSLICEKEACAIADLAAAIRYVEGNHPLPRCDHGKALMDGAGELLFPSCGCQMAS